MFVSPNNCNTVKAHSSFHQYYNLIINLNTVYISKTNEVYIEEVEEEEIPKPKKPGKVYESFEPIEIITGPCKYITT